MREECEGARARKEKSKQGGSEPSLHSAEILLSQKSQQWQWILMFGRWRAKHRANLALPEIVRFGLLRLR